MAKETLLYGARQHTSYSFVGLPECVGKTVEGVVETWVPGSEGPERCYRLLFSDGTQHGFVMPTDDEDRPSNVEAGLECGDCGEDISESPCGCDKDPSLKDPMNPEDLKR